MNLLKLGSFLILACLLFACYTAWLREPEHVTPPPRTSAPPSRNNVSRHRPSGKCRLARAATHLVEADSINVSSRCPPITTTDDTKPCCQSVAFDYELRHVPYICERLRTDNDICGGAAVPVAKFVGYSLRPRHPKRMEKEIMLDQQANTTSADAVRSCLAECLAELECVGFVLRDWLCVTKSSVLGVVVDPSATSYLLAYTPPLPAVPRPLQPSYLAIIAAPHRNVLLPAAALGASPQNSTPVHPTRWPVAIELRDSGGRATLFGSHFGSCFRLSLACSLSVASGDSDNASLCANEPASPLWFADVAVPLDVVSLRVEQAGPGSLPYSLSGHQLEHSFRLLCDGEQRLVVTRRYVVTLPATNFAAARIAASAWPLSSPRCTGIRLSAQQCCFPFLRVSLEHRQGQRIFNSSDVELEGAWVVASLHSGFGSALRFVGGSLAHFHYGIAVFSHLLFEVSEKESAALRNSTRSVTVSFRFEQVARPWETSVVLLVSDLLSECLFASIDATSESVLSTAPVVVSAVVHTCVECVMDMARNVGAFVRPSVLLLHVPHEFSTMHAMEARLKVAHAMAMINPTTVSNRPDRVMWAHLVNVRFAMASLLWTNFTHILFLSSTELFVRPGVVNYIRRYDTVEMAPPGPSAGFLYEHYRSRADGSPFLEHHFLTAEELYLDYAGTVPKNIMVHDSNLRRALQLQRLFRFPTVNVYLEGSFFSRSLAGELASALSFFDDSTFKEEPVAYVMSEFYIAALFQNVCSRPRMRCGHRVSTVTWGQHACADKERTLVLGEGVDGHRRGLLPRCELTFRSAVCTEEDPPERIKPDPASYHGAHTPRGEYARHSPPRAAKMRLSGRTIPTLSETEPFVKLASLGGIGGQLISYFFYPCQTDGSPRLFVCEE